MSEIFSNRFSSVRSKKSVNNDEGISKSVSETHVKCREKSIARRNIGAKIRNITSSLRSRLSLFLCLPSTCCLNLHVALVAKSLLTFHRVPFITLIDILRVRFELLHSFKGKCVGVVSASPGKMKFTCCPRLFRSLYKRKHNEWHFNCSASYFLWARTCSNINI